MNTLANSLLRRARKAVVACGLVVGLTLGSATVAQASSWNFSYSGSGLNVTGTLTAVFIPGAPGDPNLWSVTSITGMHNLDPISGLWTQTFGPNAAADCPGAICNRPRDNNFLAGPSFGSPAWVWDQVDLHFIANGQQYSFGYIQGYDANPNTEGFVANLDHDYTGRCLVGGADPCTVVSQQSFVAVVPEINASAGLEALAVLFVLGLFLREFTLRRRGSELPI